MFCKSVSDSQAVQVIGPSEKNLKRTMMPAPLALPER
ncbi:MAG: hypothetical protein QOH48_2073 [Actinomycetota bacterium]|nr:hypothetical protein [Actinomycetota bacterium]